MSYSRKHVYVLARRWVLSHGVGPNLARSLSDRQLRRVVGEEFGGWRRFKRYARDSVAGELVGDFARHPAGQPRQPNADPTP